VIVVSVQLKSAIHPSRDATLGRVEIANDGTGDKDTGNYDIRVYGKRGQLMTTARVEKFPRRAKHGLRLLTRALAAAFPNEVTLRTQGAPKT
jgi:hypothetical protein